MHSSTYGVKGKTDMEFQRQLTDKIDKINNILIDYLPKAQGKQKLLLEAMNYSVQVGGKRIRPMFLLETYQLCRGENEKEVYPYMAALEYIHTYSLVHDDLPAMDNDDYRRGNLTTHKKFGEDFGILAGDGLLNYAYEVLMKAILSSKDMEKNAKAGSIIAQKAGIYGMVGGQSLDVLLTQKKVSQTDLEFIFNCKTGALIEAAFMVGGVLAGVDDDTIKQLEKAGNLVGVAFQIKDDILDITSTQEEFGKPVFSDERNKKTTYVTLYGMEKANEDVMKMSKKAEDIVRNIGNNIFLVELINKLINRIK